MHITPAMRILSEIAAGNEVLSKNRRIPKEISEKYLTKIDGRWFLNPNGAQKLINILYAFETNFHNHINGHAWSLDSACYEGYYVKEKILYMYKNLAIVRCGGYEYAYFEPSDGSWRWPRGRIVFKANKPMPIYEIRKNIQEYVR